MGLSFNEIRKRAIEFSHEWAEESREIAEAKTFWDGFFNVFGISRRRVAVFEEPVKNLVGEKRGWIDLFWKGTLIVEHKSAGKSLDKAFTQAADYFPGIANEADLPKYVLVSDFKRFRLYDLDEGTTHEFALSELYSKIHLFDFILGYKKQEIIDEDPVNIKAAQLMGKLHDLLKQSGYSGHQLEMFLVRIMFCLFADDTGIFSRDHFTYYLESKSRQDGSDMGTLLSELFQVLNTDVPDRQRTIDEDLNAFPYVNGSLFDEQLRIPSFDSGMRKTILECCHFDWSTVSPAIFGSLFQSVMDEEKRREIGAHYTSEKNILKAIRSLFLDDLKKEFDASRNSSQALRRMLDRISKLKFLDPACGCGNFLVIAYRELRLIEIEILKQLRRLSKDPDQTILDIDLKKVLNVDSMYGIEIEEFPARIAEVALWLVDHQMNIRLSKELGGYFVRLPLKISPHIVNDNAIRVDWEKLVPKAELSFILGNPPYAGKKRRNEQQNQDMGLIMRNRIEQYGVLDYVAAWYVKAAEYIQNTPIKVAFVSTKSITHGEQVSILWGYLLQKGIKIHFAHRTFAWTNEAKGKAAVFVVVIGFAAFDASTKVLFDYETPKSDPVEIKAKNINPYLVDQVDFVIGSRHEPICEVPAITFGSMPNDNGNFLFTDTEKDGFLKLDPGASKFIRPLISAREFLSGEKRWCLWLVDAQPAEIKAHPEILRRVENVRKFRSASKREGTKKLADYPYLFGEIRQPNSDYVVIPLHSSESRKFVPMGFLSKDNIANNSCSVVPDARLYHFGVMMSTMHMAWVRQICGRIKGDYRYSNNVVYNNFPWPKNPADKNVKEVERRAKELTTIREVFKDQCLADLYSPNLMPKRLVDAHNKLDKAVDKCYRSQPFVNELNRLRFLFRLYREYSPGSLVQNLDEFDADEDAAG
jgi:type I restriction-modification system DNA methylase subunit